MSKFKFVQWYGIVVCLLMAACTDVDITMPKGPKGDTGLSAYEFWKEKVADGTVDWPKDQTEVADFFKYLKGNDGKDGKDGVGIREVSLNGSGELIVALTDGTETNLGKITGEDGAPGVGISSVQVGENGMLTVTLSNGESVEAGAVFSAQEGKTVRTVSYITAAAAALAFLWLAVLTTLFAKSRRTAVHR